MARTIFPYVPPNTCSINVRLSKQAKEENLSKDGMLKDCIALAESMGLEVVNVHIDDGLSGAIRNRKGFTGWLDDARQGRCDHLIAWHVDRMTREGINVAGLILDAIEGKDPETGKVVRRPVRLLDTKGLDSQGDETAFRFRFVIAAEVARAERERMRDRSRNANNRARAAGRWPGGDPPYGFKAVANPDGPGKVLVHHPDEVKLLQEAASRILALAADGKRKYSLGSVIRWANGPAGVPPRRAKAWSRRSIMTILCGWPVRGVMTKKVNGKLVPIIDDQGNVVRIGEILTPDESAAIRALSASRSYYTGGRKPLQLLSTLLRCRSCLAVMYLDRRKTGRVDYRCGTSGSTCDCPAPVSVNAAQVEQYMTDYFLERWGESPEYAKHAQVTGAAEVEAAELAVTAALNALAQKASLENLAALQDAQDLQKAALEVPQESQILILPTGRTIAEAWEAGTVDDRRELLATNYAEIIVGPGRPGSHKFDATRLEIVSQPPHPVGHLDEDWRAGTVTVAV